MRQMHRPPLNSLNCLPYQKEKHFESHGEEKKGANLTLPQLFSESAGQERVNREMIKYLFLKE